MCEKWYLTSQCMVNIDLPGCVVDMVIAAYDMADLHIQIIDHDGEVVGWRAIRAGDDQVVQLVVGYADAATHQVIKHHVTTLRIAKTHHGINSFRNTIQVSAFAVITGLDALLHLLLTQFLQPFLWAVATVGLVFIQQLLNDLGVTVETVGLVKRAFVIIQPQPVHTIQDRFNRFGG